MVFVRNANRCRRRCVCRISRPNVVATEKWTINCSQSEKWEIQIANERTHTHMSASHRKRRNHRRRKVEWKKTRKWFGFNCFFCFGQHFVAAAVIRSARLSQTPCVSIHMDTMQSHSSWQTSEFKENAYKWLEMHTKMTSMATFCPLYCRIAY